MFEIDPRAPDVAPTGAGGAAPAVNLVRSRTDAEFSRTPASGAMTVAVIVDPSVTGLLELFSGPLDYVAETYPISSSRLASRIVPASITFTEETETLAQLSEWFARQKASGGRFTHAALVTQRLTKGDPGMSSCKGGCRGVVCTAANPSKLYCGEPVVMVAFDPWSGTQLSRMRKSLAHELGHHFLLGDTYLEGTENMVVNPITSECVDSGCPVEAGAIHTLAGKVSVEIPDDDLHRLRFIDFMANSDEFKAWVDRRTWDVLRLGIVLPKPPAPAGGAAWEATAGEWLVLSLYASRNGDVELASVARMTGPLSTMTMPGDDHAMRLLAADGSELASHAFTTELVPVNDEAQPEEAYVGLTVPFVAGTRKIQIRHDDEVVAERTVSDHPPVVTVTSPNGGQPLGSSVTVTWTASDPDGDALTFSVLVSGDGTEFVPVALGLTTTSYVLETALLSGTTNGRVRVVANDGVNEGSDTSDGPFTLARRPPVASISAPANGVVLSSDGACLLSGGAYDPEDGQLVGGSLVFTSSRDGSLGTGGHFFRALSEGSHVITLTATDSDGQTGSASVTVTVSADVPPLAVTLTATPSGGVAPLQARLTASATGGVPPYSFEWRFGDGKISLDETTQDHTWTEPGSHEALVTVTDARAATVQETVTVAVSAPQETEDYLIPAAAHAPGALGTQWLTDLVLHNPGEEGVSATVTLLERDKDNSAAQRRVFIVPWGSSLRLSDVVLSGFGEDSLAGGLGVGATGPLVVSSRTYNNAASGTYGQYIPGNSEGDAIGTGEEVRLIQLTRNTSFRTNVGLGSFADFHTTVKVTVFKADGARVGERSFTLKPHGVVQTTDLLGALGATDLADAYTTVRSDTTGASYLAYASVIDNRTGDPVQVAPAVTSSSAPLYLPAAAHVQGYGGSRWRTDLEVHNPGSVQAAFTVELLRRGTTNISPTMKSHTLEARRSVRFDDVLASQFSCDGAATVRLTPTAGTIAATQRTYNDQTAGTYGQFIAALPAYLGGACGQTARLVQLSQSASDTAGFRTNLGVVNTTSSSVTVVADLHRGNGTLLGSRTYTLPAYGYTQEDKVFRTVATGDVADGFAVLRTTTAGGRFFAYASVADNRSGDPITVPAVVFGEAACDYSIYPASRSHGAGAESGTIEVRAAAGCAWTAAAGQSWIHIDSGASGNGNGTVAYRVDANPESSARSGAIIVAGRTFGVTQAGAAAPVEITVTLPGNVPLTMVEVTAGTFQMGSPTGERGRLFGETLHEVTLTRSYYIGKHEVTQAQWVALMGSNPSSLYGVGDSYPVYAVTWDQVAGAGGFVQKLNQHLASTGQPGAGLYRLPTEAEWEYAARAGTTTAFSFGDDASCSISECGLCALFDRYMWWCGNRAVVGGTPADAAHPVGQKQPNAWGLYDMHGNIGEWVADWHGPYPSSAVVDQAGPDSGTVKKVRGGAWGFSPGSCRSATRDSWWPDAARTSDGFRLARSQ